MDWYYLNVSVHLIAAMIWLGGMLFLAVVGAPVLRRVEPPSLRAELFRRLGARFRTAGWIAIGVLLLTGAANLHFRHLLSGTILESPDFWDSTYGRALAVKLGSVVLMVVLSGVHDFVLGPAAARAASGSSQARRLGLWSAWVARLNAGVGVVLILAAVRLARGM